MKFTVDTQYLLDCFRRLVNTPSPVGYYPLLNPVLETEAAAFGCSITYDNRHGHVPVIWYSAGPYTVSSVTL